MQNKQEYQDLSFLYESIYEEGILSRAGARVAGAKAATGQYFKNIGSTLKGQAAPTGAGQAAANAKVQYAFQSAAKNLLNDLQKLGLLPKGQVSPQMQSQAEAALSEMIQDIAPQQQSQPTQQSRVQLPPPRQQTQPIQQEQPAQVTQPEAQPAASAVAQPTKKVTKPRKKKVAPKKTEDGWQQVGGSGKIRKVYSQSDEELAPMPSSFEYFGS